MKKLVLLLAVAALAISCEREIEIDTDNIAFGDSTNILMGGKWVHKDYNNYDGVPSTFTSTFIFYTDSNALYYTSYEEPFDSYTTTPEEWKYVFDGENGLLFEQISEGRVSKFGDSIKYDKESQTLLWAANRTWSMNPIYDFHREEL
ncbi:MAG: hypothetical protein IJK07_08780 [Bacteroidales bacterium]|nr:hypothetical protein [Bacteroidales bacterium]